MNKISIKIWILLLCILGISETIMAQVTVYNSEAITISSGITVTCDASFINQTNTTSGTINNQGTLSITKDWTNNAPNTVFSTSAGTTIFYNASSQIIGGTNATNFYDLTINKSANNITLNNNNNKITNILNLVAGKIILGTNTLIMDVASSVAGTPGISNYIQADGTGMLRKNFNSISTFTYPIGDNDEYSPFTFRLNTALFGIGNFISVNVTDAVHPAFIAQDHISRYWTLNAGGFHAINYDVSYQFTNADVIGNKNSIYAQRYDGSSLAAYNVVNSGTNTLSSSTGILNLPQNYAFSGEGFFILPVNLLSFKAAPGLSGTLIQWETASEINNQYYTVERSLNGVNFTGIGEIIATGNTNSLSNYSFTDDKNVTGVVYYRLRQTDMDGKISFSKIVSVLNNQVAGSFTAFFNPSANSIFINKKGVENKSVIVMLHNSQGQALFHKSYRTNDPALNQNIPFMSKMSTGIYYVTLIDGNKKFTQKLFIQ